MKKMRNFFKKKFGLVKKYKIISIIVLFCVLVGGYFLFSKVIFAKQGQVSYKTAFAQKTFLISSVSGTGQVSSSNEVEIKPKVSGEVVLINTKNGQAVKSGALLLQIDATDALKSIRDAESSLESARLSLEKLAKPADNLSVIQAQNSLLKAKESKSSLEDGLSKSYEDSFNKVADAFLDIPNVMSGLNGVLFGADIVSSQWNLDYYRGAINRYDTKGDTYADNAYNSYEKARKNYDTVFLEYKGATIYSSDDDIEKLLSNSYDLSKNISQAIKDAKNLVDYYADTATKHEISQAQASKTQQSSLSTYTGTMASQVSSLLSQKSSIESSKNALLSNERDIQEKEESIKKLLAGADELDIKSQQLNIRQKENVLLDAKQKLQDYYIKAPFDGVITGLEVRKGDGISSGASVATIITHQKMAVISLNEIDVASIKAGQKANITFDAISDFSITGEVSDVDVLGTVTQGVVSYGVKIVFDVQDERIKPGMSLGVSIITNSKPDVLAVSSSAVKTSGDSKYVEVLVDGKPVRKTVEIGISSDTMIEILSGLDEGDNVITQTVSPSQSQVQSSVQTGGGGSRGVFQLGGGR